MSKEIADDFIDQINESRQEDFAGILEAVVYYGFIDDLGLAKLFDVDLDDIDELLTSCEHLTTKEWKSYAVKLRNYMKREKAKYERMYYADRDDPSL